MVDRASRDPTANSNGHSAVAEKVLESLPEKIPVPSNLYATSKGVVLQVKVVSDEFIRLAVSKIPNPDDPDAMPDAPWFTPSEQEPGTVMKNIDHPKYARAVIAYNDECNTLRFDMGMWYGVEPVSVPEGMYLPDEDGWIEELTDPDLFGDRAPLINRSGKRRFLDWCRYYAMGASDYIPLAELIVTGKGDVLEKDVESAEQSFRGNDRR